jgi:hypothetical protein
MDAEEQTERLLGLSHDDLADVKVFPLIVKLKRDVTVRRLRHLVLHLKC